MKLYVLTHRTLTGNYTPQVFTDARKAEKALDEEYEKLLHETSSESIEYTEKYPLRALVCWIDESEDELEIFEVELSSEGELR